MTRHTLSNLRNIAEMFEMGYLTNEEVQWLMKDINPLIKGAELTLSNLMEWAGSHFRGRSVNSSRLDIFLLGVEMEQTFNHALQRKSIEFVNQASPGQSVLADENHIKVVLRNLISNAIKFTDTNGSITLNSVYEENKVEPAGRRAGAEPVDPHLALRDAADPGMAANLAHGRLQGRDRQRCKQPVRAGLAHVRMDHRREELVKPKRGWPLVVRLARDDDRDAVMAFATNTWNDWDYVPRAWPRWLEAKDGVMLVGVVGGGRRPRRGWQNARGWHGDRDRTRGDAGDR